MAVVLIRSVMGLCRLVDGNQDQVHSRDVWLMWLIGGNYVDTQ
jgi:hypothetical protein